MLISERKKLALYAIHVRCTIVYVPLTNGSLASTTAETSTPSNLTLMHVLSK